MRLFVPAGQEATVHLGVQSLNTSLANLGEARNITDIGNLQTASQQCGHRTTSGNNLITQLVQGGGKLHHSPLIANAY